MATHNPGILSGKKILVVDDELDLREIISEDLELLGAEVFNAENGRSAFELAKLVHPHLIVSDVRMSGGDGIELLNRIKELPQNPSPYVFLITGFADMSLEVALSLGAQGMLSKPFNLKQLRELVSETLVKKPVEAT